jgi:hypothetical protein
MHRQRVVLATEVSLDINEMLIFGRTVRGIVEGDSVPDIFIPRLINLWRRPRSRSTASSPATTSPDSTRPRTTPSRGA